MALFKSKSAGKVSPIVIGDCAGLLPPLVSVKISVVVAPSLIVAAPKVLATLARTTDTQAPALGVTPLVALGVIAEVMLVVVLMLLLVLAFGARVQAPMVGATAVVMGTIIVHAVAGLTI